MVAEVNSKIPVMAGVREFTTALDLNGTVLPGIVVSVTPSVTLSALIISLHQILRKRSLEWVEKNEGLKDERVRVEARKDRDIWFMVSSQSPEEIMPSMLSPTKEYLLTDWFGSLRRMIREGSI